MMLEYLHNLPQESNLIIDAGGLQHLKDHNKQFLIILFLPRIQEKL